MNIGVLSLQGAFLKHMHLLKTIGVNPVNVRYSDDLSNLHGLIIPGGESTVLSKLIMKQSLYEPLEKYISKYPVYGTCAGLILLSKTIENNKLVRSFASGFLSFAICFFSNTPLSGSPFLIPKIC